MASAGSIVVDLLARTGSFQTDMDRASKIAQRRAKEMESAFDRMAGKITGAFSGLLAGVTVAATATKLVEVQRQFDVLNASLVTVTGSSKGAATEFAWIKEFAAQTPFDLAQVTDAFIKMKAFGLDASEAALRSYGNTASAMGKSLNQMIEAVADAATGEFERLKEFGIRAAKQGDQVTFTFKGVSKTIKMSSEEITKYLKDIGDNDFAGAMAERTKTLDGAISNLGDTWDELFRTINNAGVGALIFDATALATQGIQNLINNIKVLQQYAAPQGQMRVDSLVGDRTKLQQQLADLEGRGGDVAATARADIQRRIDKINAEVGRLQDEWIRTQNVPATPAMPPRAEAPSIGGGGRSPRASSRASGLTEEQKAHNDAMKEGARIYEQTRTASEKLSMEFARLNDLRKAGAIDQETYNRAVFDAQENFDTLIAKTKEATDKGKDSFDQLRQAIDGWGKSSAEALVDFALTGKSSFKDMVNSILADLARMMVYRNITGPLANKISGMDWGSIGSAVAGMFGGFRASGGPVSGGTSYIVGERGPELFTPHTSGAIVPNGALGGAKVSIVVNNNAGSDTRASASATTDATGNTQIMVMVEKIEGMMGRRIGQGGGLAPMLEGRYGLNPAAGARR